MEANLVFNDCISDICQKAGRKKSVLAIFWVPLYMGIGNNTTSLRIYFSPHILIVVLI